MVGPQPRNVSCHVRGYRTLNRTRLTAIWHTALECDLRKSHHPLDEIAEDVGQILVHVSDKAWGQKVGVGTLWRIRDQPPAP
jgi:hypothetical protein